MQIFIILSEAWRYPYPGQLEGLQAAAAQLPDQPGKKSLSAFLEQLAGLTFGEREELYTRSFDLSPLMAPYVGFHLWGESYQRGNFMASLNRALQTANVDLGGELPDHLSPILRYLGEAALPLPDLTDALPRALQSMQRTLQKADPHHPYLGLLEAVQQACEAQFDSLRRRS